MGFNKEDVKFSVLSLPRTLSLSKCQSPVPSLQSTSINQSSSLRITVFRLPSSDFRLRTSPRFPITIGISGFGLLSPSNNSLYLRNNFYCQFIRLFGRSAFGINSNNGFGIRTAQMNPFASGFVDS